MARGTAGRDRNRRRSVSSRWPRTWRATSPRGRRRRGGGTELGTGDWGLGIGDQGSGIRDQPDGDAQTFSGGPMRKSIVGAVIVGLVVGFSAATLVFAKQGSTAKVF